MNKTSVLYFRSGTTKRKITRPVGSKNTGTHPDFPNKCLSVCFRSLPVNEYLTYAHSFAGFHHDLHVNLAISGRMHWIWPVQWSCWSNDRNL